MSEHKSEVCIGGPHDGKHVKVNPEARFTVAIRQRAPGPDNSVRVKFVSYVRQAISTSNGDWVSFWVLEGQPELVALEKLLAGYPRT